MADTSFPFALIVDGEAIPFSRVRGTQTGTSDLGVPEHHVLWVTEAGAPAATQVCRTVAEAVTALQFEQRYLAALEAARETFHDMRFMDSPYIGQVWAFPITDDRSRFPGKYFDRWMFTCTYNDELGNPAYDEPTDVEHVLGAMVDSARKPREVSEE